MKVSCYHCRKPLPKGAPQVISGGRRVCEDCIYLIEHNRKAKRIPKPPQTDLRHPQTEELFS